MSLKINLVLLLKFAVSSSHKNISLIWVNTFQQDKVDLSSFPMEADTCCHLQAEWQLKGEFNKDKLFSMVKIFWMEALESPWVGTV